MKGYSLSRVTSITETAKQSYYTLHVPGVEHYFANGILHHNSGKTAVIVRGVIMRALKHKSRHAILRYRFNHLKSSIIYDTLPAVMEKFFPGVKGKLDKSDWFYELQNGSQIWFGGLDDKERTEKILGNEYAGIFFNECSQIPWQSRNTAITRLAQNTPLKLRAWYDCNPPSDTHWTARLFIQKVDPDTRSQLPNKDDYASMRLNPKDNPHLPSDYLKTLEGLPERMRRRFLLGEFGSAQDTSLWTYELIDKSRHEEGPLPEFVKIVVGVDPSGCRGEEDKRSDEIGIVVVGLATDGTAYVLEDCSLKGGPAEWGAAAVSAYRRHGANTIVAEVNFGGAMVAETIRVSGNNGGLRVPVREVHASRGKHIRAEPIAALYSQGKVLHAGIFKELEDQLCDFTTAGYAGQRSPDRGDALFWALTDLFPALTRQQQEFGHGYRNGKTPQVIGGYSAVYRKSGTARHHYGQSVR